MRKAVHSCVVLLPTTVSSNNTDSNILATGTIRKADSLLLRYGLKIIFFPLALVWRDKD